ncbi:Rha family transcriptional regulator [Desulfovibrio sp. OttesenSCG-928-A18]|nr:Rha family transcriptional regulator [Desulfovibrio sp. OttesenSCG-928-A18]
MKNNQPVLSSLSVVGGVPRVSSLDVARHFEKDHADVLKAIRKIISECPPNFNEGNFSGVEYSDAKGETRPAYALTRDGFALLAMGFTGKRALEWKIKYIEAFNAMEKALIEQHVALRPAPACAIMEMLPPLKLHTRPGQVARTATIKERESLYEPVCEWIKSMDRPCGSGGFFLGLSICAHMAGVERFSQIPQHAIKPLHAWLEERIDESYALIQERRRHARAARLAAMQPATAIL